MLSRLLMIFTLRCRDSDRLMSESRDRGLGRAERMALRMHCMVCRSCRVAHHQLDQLCDELQRLGEDAGDGVGTLSAEARERMERAIARSLDSTS